MKEKLETLFGNFGCALYYLSALLLIAIPFILIDCPAWLAGLLITASAAIPYIGIVIQIAVWIWGLVVAISLPTDFWVIVFYIGFFLFIVSTIVPAILSLLPDRKRKTEVKEGNGSFAPGVYNRTGETFNHPVDYLADSVPEEELEEDQEEETQAKAEYKPVQKVKVYRREKH
ncbi:MAG TPA: hypothetical protein H9710_05780 [Candidatus Acutalibacter pullicola]|uniref:Uncharacterized protein n=1 Tax=Candidatus Acutalibacter pullicola TaxID=2838417 RepID=A0A9D2MVA0_9FIRM|nr:hypothetical protein [Candidatus Acutalibacter pullicola]